MKVSFSAPWPAVICAAEDLISLAVAVYKKAKNSHLAHLAHGAQCRRAGRAHDAQRKKENPRQRGVRPGSTGQGGQN